MTQNDQLLRLAQHARSLHIAKVIEKNKEALNRKGSGNKEKSQRTGTKSKSNVKN